MGKSYSANLAKWVMALPKESVFSLWSKFLSACRDMATKWVKTTLAPYPIPYRIPAKEVHFMLWYIYWISREIL
jgi:hypothetical protein